MPPLKLLLRRPWRLFVAVGFSVAIILGVGSRWRRSKVTHDGRSAADWFAAYCDEEWVKAVKGAPPAMMWVMAQWEADESIPENYQRAFGAMPAATCGKLTAVLGQSLEYDARYEFLVGRLPRPIRQLLPKVGRRFHERRVAIRVFSNSHQGWPAEVVVNSLRELSVRSPDACLELVGQMNQIGPEVAELMAQIWARVPDGSQRATAILDRTESSVTNAIKVLEASAQDPDIGTRVMAIRVLARIGPGNAAALRLLSGATNDPVDIVRDRALRALGMLADNETTAAAP